LATYDFYRPTGGKLKVKKEPGLSNPHENAIVFGIENFLLTPCSLLLYFLAHGKA
jgi:hypothetical protein